MFKLFTDTVNRITNIKTLLAATALIIILEVAFNMLFSEFSKITGGSILDMSVWYSPEFAYERLNAITKDASVFYFRIRAIDFFFPAVYAFFLSILSSFVYRKKYNDPENYRWILFVPFLAAIADYTENMIMVVLFRLLPAEYHVEASILNIVTIIKFGLICFSILLIVTGWFSLIKGSDSVLQQGNKFKGEKK